MHQKCPGQIHLNRTENCFGWGKRIFTSGCTGMLLWRMQSTELLVKSLRDRSGWQQLIKYDVDSLKEAEYQVTLV